MNVFMNGGMSPYFNSMRPLVSSPMLPGMLPALPGSAAAVANHRFLTMGGLGGLGNPLLPLPGLPGLPQPAQMEMPRESHMSNNLSPLGGMKIPLKVPEVPVRNTNGGVHIEEIEDTSVPQDLSTKSPATIASDAEPTDFSSNRDIASPKVNGETESISSPEPALTENGYQTDETRSSATPIDIKPHHHEREPEDEDETMDLSTKEIPAFCSSYCQHAKKLRLLRKSVVHMLSVLTPGLNMENGLDYDSDAVDELLHEVIYSNMDDVLDGKD
jgi:hypothetical protein